MAHLNRQQLTDLKQLNFVVFHRENDEYKNSRLRKQVRNSIKVQIYEKSKTNHYLLSSVRQVQFIYGIGCVFAAPPIE